MLIAGKQGWIERLHSRTAALIFRLINGLIGQQLIKAVVIAQERKSYHIVPVVPNPLFHLIPFMIPHMNGDGAVVIHIMLHEHFVIFQLFHCGHIRFYPSGRRFHRKFNHFGHRIIRILSHLRKHRITQVLTYPAERVRGGDADSADIVGRMGIMHAA